MDDTDLDYHVEQMFAQNQRTRMMMDRVRAARTIQSAITTAFIPAVITGYSIYTLMPQRGGFWRRGRRYKHYRAGRGRDASVKATVKRILRESGEMKYHDVIISNTTAVAGTSFLQHLTDIDEGDGNDERTAESIFIHSIRIYGSIQGDADALLDTSCRMVLFRANENLEGAAPAITDVLTADDINAIGQIDNRGDFTTFLNARSILPVRDSTTGSIIPRGHIEYFKKLKKPYKCHYDGTGAGIADAERGHWFLLLMTNQANTYQPGWEMRIRIRYKELA